MAVPTRTMVLPSGLTVQMCRMPGFVTAYAMLTVGVGSIDIGYRVRGREVSLPAGVAHYLEHKMFDCPYGDAMQRFDALGASANAFTSFDKTAYYFSCTENFSKALEVLLDFVAMPYFTGPSVRRERGIIAEELRMYRDSLDDAARAAFDQAFNDASFTDGDAGRIADSIRAAGFDQATRMAAEGYLDKARAALASLPSGPEQDILQQMADYVRDRKK